MEAEAEEAEEMVRITDEELASSSLLQDNVKIRDFASMPPLFARLSERKPTPLDYLGVSYGLTSPLHKFWHRRTFVPVYLRQTPNELTGEHTCVMLRALDAPNNFDAAELGAYARDFHRRFLSLLSYQFRSFASPMALAIDASASAGVKLDTETAAAPLTKQDLDAV
ncbi:N-acetyltransferase 10, partial [Cryomyces antarcticus]